APEDRSRGGARRNPRHLIAVRHNRFRLAEGCRVTAQHRDNIVRGHGSFGQGGRPRLIRAVIIEDLLERQLLTEALNYHTARVVDLLHGYLDALSLILPGLGLPAGDRKHDPDFYGAALSGTAAAASHWPKHTDKR